MAGNKNGGERWLHWSLALYREPTTFTYKVGDKTGTGSSTTANRFYFTHLDSCSYWREYFLVIRAKGLRHDGKHIDIYGKIPLYRKIVKRLHSPREQVMRRLPSMERYNATGTAGKYDGANGTSIGTNTATSGSIYYNTQLLVQVTYKVNGYFESHFGVSTMG